MKKNLFTIFAAFAIATAGFSTTVSAQYSLAGAPIVQGEKVSDRGIAPVAYAGNFVAVDDDQICYDLSVLGGWDVQGEMRGFKQDPPIGNTFSFNGGNSSVSTSISGNGQFLSWSTVDTNAIVLAFIIKGGPNFNLYNYGPSNPWDSDGGLSSPGSLNKKGQLVFPQISHYNLCAMPRDNDDEGGDEGCTPGYWRNHTDRWLGADPTDTFDETFGVTSGLGATFTLYQAIWASGGGANALARHATAAYLNSLGGVPNEDGDDVEYPMTTAEVIAAVQAAFADGGDIEGTKDLFAGYNELGCPLGGTNATK